MKKIIIIHSENEERLRALFQLINEKVNPSEINLFLHAKGYIPWIIPDINQQIRKFAKYSASPTIKEETASILEILLNVKEDQVIILREEAQNMSMLEWDSSCLDSLCCSKKELLGLKLDTKYKSLKWFIIDIFSQRDRIVIESDESKDSERYFQKINSVLFSEKIIYIDGGLGDHVMALPLLEKIAENTYVSCKYPIVYSHLLIKGIIPWDDELFGGYDRFVYQYGSSNESHLIIDAFFEMYGYVREKEDILMYNGASENSSDVVTDKKIALICTSAAKINGLDSNKDWRDIRWLKLVHELKKRNYYVIQVGSSKDSQIPNADFKFLDQSLSKLKGIILRADLWISVDTFFHHFASAIKPEVGICLTPYYNDHAKHPGVKYIEKDCGKDFSGRRWWLDLQQPERKECMDLITIENVLEKI